MNEGSVKTQPRAQSFIIKRPRLTGLLDESGARILLLVAPAGYGKTTLAREWLEGKDDVAWYSAGPSMADVAALAAGVADAFTVAAGRDDRELVERVQILAARGQNGEALARAIAAAEVTAECSILALDDCHHAIDSEESTAFIEELLSRTSFRVVATSRARPSWVTPRMVVYGEAAVLEMGQLAFTDAEAQEVLGESELHQTALAGAGGWPAVIGLAAMRSRAGADADGLRTSDLYAFFAQDLYETASSVLQQALLAFALGGDALTTVARDLLGEDSDALIADALERGFLATSGETSELHPLLRGFLISKVKALPCDGRDTLIRRIATILADRTCWDAALALLEEFPISELIASTMARALVELLSAGRISTVRRWVKLADANRVEDPIVLLAEAELALRERDERRAQALGGRAGERFGSGDLAARAYVVAGRAAHLSDAPLEARSYCAKAETLAASVEIQADALWIQFVSAVEESGSGASAIFERMQELDDETPEHGLRVHIAKAFLLLLADHVPRPAAEELALAAGLLDRVQDPVLRTSYLNMHSHIMVVLGNYELALQLARRQSTEAEANGLDFVLDHSLLSQAAALIGLRRFRAAESVITQLERRSMTATDYILRNTNVMRARLRIGVGDLERAEIFLRRRTGTSQIIWPEQDAYHGLVLASLGQTEEARQRLSACEHPASNAGYSLHTAAIAGLAKVVVDLSRGAESAAQSACDALDESLKTGLVDAVVTACRAFPELARTGGQDTQLANALTEAFIGSRDVDLGRRAGLDMPREFRRNEDITPREREVYELLAHGRTNAEIARTLFISESTVKVHVRHIFEKLGVHNRAEAARALHDAG